MISYKDYYQQCREIYSLGSNGGRSIYDLHFKEIHPSVSNIPWLPLPPGYEEAIHSLAEKVAHRFSHSENLYPVPAIAGYAKLLYDFWEFEELNRLAAWFIPALEEHLYGTYVAINQINLVRTVPSAAPPRSSWLWHYDDNPAESVKLLLYLTTVSRLSGAFEYLWKDEIQQGYKVETSRLGYGLKGKQRWPKSRVPAKEIERLKSEGYQARHLVGPPGTMILFDNNCIHRATIPKEAYRDVVIFNFRPSHEMVHPYVHRRHTGSWDYNAKNWDPNQIQLPPMRKTATGAS